MYYLNNHPPDPHHPVLLPSFEQFGFALELEPRTKCYKPRWTRNLSSAPEGKDS